MLHVVHALYLYASLHVSRMTKCGKSVFNQLQPQQVLQRSGTIMDLQTHSPFRHDHVLQVLAMITSDQKNQTHGVYCLCQLVRRTLAEGF